jgi:hypothetical protein
MNRSVPTAALAIAMARKLKPNLVAADPEV